jgi:hypothetical protein
MPSLLMMLLLAAMNANAAPPAGQSVTVPIMAMNDSGQTGTATLTPEGDRTRVVVELTGVPEGVVEPEHIHLGTCDKLNPAPKWPLQPLQNGRSVTVVPVSLATIMKDQTAINVHKSPTEIATYVACGNIPRGK